MSLIKEYFDLTDKYQQEYGPNTILLMQVGAFFEVYGTLLKDTHTITNSKIQDFSRICELNIVEKNTCVGENGNIVMAGFKDIQVEKYIKKIQDAGFTAVVYTQDENVKNTTRSLAGIFSPGTYFHNESQHLSNSTTCIWIDYIENKVFMKGKYVVVGISNIDIYTGKSTIFQFKELYVNNPTTYDELERFISIYNPSEVILISNVPDVKEMDTIISYAGISCSTIHKIHLNDALTMSKRKETLVKNCEKQCYQKEILSTFFTFSSFDIFIQNFNDHNIATQSFCYLLDFIYQHNPQLVSKIAEPVFENTSKRLSLANHSLKQLNIINDGNVKPTKYSCVSEMLNQCLTPMGKRRFLYNLLHPICDETVLQREYDITEYVLSILPTWVQSMKPKLSVIKDISKMERQLFLKKITPKSLYLLCSNIQSISEIFAMVKHDNTIMQYLRHGDPTIDEIGDLCETIQQFIQQNIDIQLAKEIEQCQQFETNFIRSNVDIDLDKKADLLKCSELSLESIRSYFSLLIERREKKSSKSSDYVKIHETEKNQYSLICTSRRCNLLKEALPSVAETVSLPITKEKSMSFTLSKDTFSYEKQSSSNVFIMDSQISSLCKNISTIKISMKDLITNVYNKIIDQLGSFQKELERIIQFITMMDMIYTKASIAKQYHYCKPVIKESKKAFLDAKGLRHCLIEQFHLNELYVTNDVCLGDGYTDGILLFGTNAVGKTTIIRALGIAVILAQAGLFVPCSSFHYKPYQSIFTRIIGNDNIFKGLSTFEVEMSELRTILRLMNENSLVLGDELCSGTETVSAISIFVAGIQRLHKAKSSFIFATHLHEIVDYEEIREMKTVHLKHMEVVYNKEKNMLIYNRKLRYGSGTNVYGLEVCKSLDLPDDFLECANQIRLKYNSDGQSMLSLKQSRYNTNKLVNLCERCGENMGTEVHHMEYQHLADDDGIIQTNESIFHKNNAANLMTLCEGCHLEMHKKGIKLKKVKTSHGHQIIDIS